MRFTRNGTGFGAFFLCIYVADWSLADATPFDCETHAPPCPPNEICYNNNNNNNNNGRLNLEETTRRPAVADLKELMSPQKCGTYEYDVDLILLQHFYLYLQPSPAAAQKGCPTALIHTGSSPTVGETLEKEFLIVLEDFTSLESLGFSGQNGALIDFGTYPFGDIVQAFLKADVDAPGLTGQEYNFVLNNCGDLIANILYELGHAMTSIDSQMIAAGMIKVFPNFASLVRNSVLNETEHHILHSMSDVDVALYMVEVRTTKMYQAKQQAKMKSIQGDVDKLQQEMAEMKIEVAALRGGEVKKHMYGPPDTLNIRSYDEAISFCNDQGLSLGSYQDYCGDTSKVFQGAKESHEWAPTSDHYNAWVFVGLSTERSWKECTSHEAATGKDPAWGIDNTSKQPYEANYVLCTE